MAVKVVNWFKYEPCALCGVAARKQCVSTKKGEVGKGIGRTGPHPGRLHTSMLKECLAITPRPGAVSGRPVMAFCVRKTHAGGQHQTRDGHRWG